MPKPMTSSVLSIVVLIVLSGGASAQTATPVQSFTDLQPLIRVDQEILVWADDGRKTRARVVAVGGGTLEIQRPRRFFGAGRREVFAESSVRRIEHRDSTVNGGLMGFAVGLGVAFAVAKTSQCEDLCELPVVALAPVVGPLIGAAIDGAINRSLFISPAPTKITGLPRLGRAPAVVSASLRF
jgi:hypothetical protein